MLHLDDHGAGPAVLILHGAPAAAWEFAPLVTALSQSHRVLRADLPGYGSSDAITDGYSLARVSALIEAELAHRGVREVAIVGHSLGAYRALQIALRNVVHVNRLVILGGFANVDDAARAGFRQFAAAMRAGGGGLDLHAIWQQRALSPAFAANHPDVVARVRSILDEVPFSVMADEFDAVATSEDLRPRLGEISSPVFVRVGELDGAVSPAWCEEIARGVPHGTFERVPAIGHAQLEEDEVATIRAVREALA